MMSVSAMVEPFDSQMSDFIEDSEMGLGGPSQENWFHQQPSTHMEEDSNFDLASDTLEVEMMGDGYDETIEYEMEEDPGPQHLAHEGEVIDAEVYDVQTSPQPPVSSGAMLEDPPAIETTNQLTPAHFTPAIEFAPVIEHTTSATSTHHFDERASSIPPIFQGAPLPDTGEAHPTALPPTMEISASALPDNDPGNYGPNADVVTGAAVLKDTTAEGETHAFDTLAAVPQHLEGISDIAQLGEVQTAPQEPTSENNASVGEALLPSDVLPVSNEDPSLMEARASVESVEFVEHTAAMSNTALAGGVSIHDVAVPHPEVTPPEVLSPTIFLKLNVSSNEEEQPEFVLFTAPFESKVDDGENPVEEPLVLLQHQIHLFFEPISNIFETLRQEEYFSHIAELVDSEMVLSADDLQLSISEDNVYAREVSLQDLLAMHQGVGLSGHLRLTLESVMPRFINRYNLLRDRITRLSLGDEEAFKEQVVTVDSTNGILSQQQESAEEHIHEEPPKEVHDSIKEDDEADEAEHYREEQKREDDGERKEDEEGEDEQHEDRGQADGVGEGKEDEEGEDEQHEDCGQAEGDEQALDAIEAVAINETEGQQPYEEGEDEHGEVCDAIDTAEPDRVEGSVVIAGHDADTVAEGDLIPATKSDTPQDNAFVTAVPEEAADIEETVAVPENEDDDFGPDDDGFDDFAPDTQATLEDQAAQDHPFDPLDEGHEQAQSITYTTSTSSLSTDDGEWTGETDADADAEGVDEFEVPDNDNEQLENTHDEQGNTAALLAGHEPELDGADEFGDEDFDEFDFEGSTEETLDDPIEDASTTLHSVEGTSAEGINYESTKLIGDLLAEHETQGMLTSASLDDHEIHSVFSDDASDEKEVTDDVVTKVNDRSKQISVRSTSKRSHDAELDVEEASSPDSPGAKRSRVF